MSFSDIPSLHNAFLPAEETSFPDTTYGTPYNERQRAEVTQKWSPIPLVGYRSWEANLTPEGVTIVGHTGTPWPLPYLVASCSRDTLSGRASAKATKPHEAPSANCQCGIYSSFTLTGVPIMGAYGWGLLGRVLSSGKVITGDSGMRAARAHVNSAVLLEMVRGEQRIRAMEASAEVARQIEAAWGIEVPIIAVPMHMWEWGEYLIRWASKWFDQIDPYWLPEV